MTRQSPFKTTRDATSGEFEALCARILATADAANADHERKEAAERRDNALRNRYAVQVITADDLVQAAEAWRGLIAKPPEHISNGRNLAAWASAMARQLNGDGFWLVRRYWKRVATDVLAHTQYWPTAHDMMVCAKELAKTEGVR